LAIGLSDQNIATKTEDQPLESWMLRVDLGSHGKGGIGQLRHDLPV